MTIPIFDDIALARRTILRRVPLDEIEITPAMLDANERIYGARLTPAEAVDRIILDVRGRGDAALSDWSARLDGVRRSAFEVPRARIRRAVGALAPELVEALKLAAGEIERFHRRQARNSWVDFNVEGALGQLVVPLQTCRAVRARRQRAAALVAADGGHPSACRWRRGDRGLLAAAARYRRGGRDRAGGGAHCRRGSRVRARRRSGDRRDGVWNPDGAAGR